MAAMPPVLRTDVTLFISLIFCRFFAPRFVAPPELGFAVILLAALAARCYRWFRFAFMVQGDYGLKALTSLLLP